jgi:8-oxo-dGTP diphosphatase
MTKYVVGFMFNKNLDKVVLIRKNRPNWQAGKLNGVGGHVEDGETFYGAMVREFKEETGVEVKDWTRLITITSEIDCFYSRFYFCIGNVYECNSVTDEKIEVVDVNDLPNNLIPNLKWIIPMCLDPYLKEYDTICL